MNSSGKNEPPVWADESGGAPEEEGVELQTDDLQAVEYFKQARQALTHQLGKVIAGQEEVIDQLLIAYLRATTRCWWGCPGWRRRC
jgi:hypothetical protein